MKGLAENKEWRDWLAVILLGLAVQAVWAARMPYPTYMDAYYYTVVGERLAAGHGLSLPVVWQFLDGIDALPAPAHTYWMPLPSFLAAIGFMLGGTFRAAQAPFWLMAGLLPWLAFMISKQLTGSRWQAWTAALLTAAGGYYAAYLSQPTTFAPFAWSGGLGLLALVKASSNQGTWRHWLAAGLLAGLAHLTRADGLLFLPVAWVIWWRTSKGEALLQRWRPVLAHLVGYLLIMSGWFVRNMLLLGRPLPTAGTQTIFLTNYNDLFSYGRVFGIEAYLDWGLSNILLSKLDALWLTVQTLLLVSGVVFLAPLILIAGIVFFKQKQTRDLLAPLTIYLLLLVSSMVLLFTFPSGRGSVLHSSAAIWPWMMPLAAAGLGLLVTWLAGRLSHWNPYRAKRSFAAMFVLVAHVISPIVAGTQPRRIEESHMLIEIGQQIPKDAVVMTGNPPMLYYHAGLTSISLPNEPMPGVQTAIEDFGVEYLLLDFDHPDHMNQLWHDQEVPTNFRHVADFYSDDPALCQRQQTMTGQTDEPGERCLVFRLFRVVGEAVS